MKSRLRLAPLPLLAALLLAAIVLAPGAGAAATAKPCSSKSLVIWAGEEPGGATAGSTYYRIEFTNLSGSPCRIDGPPGVSAVDLHGKRIGAPAGVEPGKTSAQLVTVPPGYSASATLRIVDALNYPKGKCKPTLAVGLRVTVPGGTGAKVAPLAFRTCAVASTETLSVSSVTGAN